MSCVAIVVSFAIVATDFIVVFGAIIGVLVIIVAICVVLCHQCRVSMDW